ncbi:hypothetical protein AB0D66_21720 [Streptomyces sp. NPDC048270]|uniref:hypothetical protein n=1 Tax=Streptomyces sp. NPDC048270 TaxID=3154615 RepID=UPI0033E876AC
MTGRGRRAPLPPATHARPEPLVDDGLMVRHINRNGRSAAYDFSTLTVAEPMQRTLAKLFAARCKPQLWGAHTTSKQHWKKIKKFTEFLSGLDHPPRDLDELTGAVVKRWRTSQPKTVTGYKNITMVVKLLKHDPRLQSGRAADELVRRMAQPKSRVQSYPEAEFDAIKTAARRMFRSALLRIEENAAHLERWRAGEVPAASQDWKIGEALDLLARTGDLTYYTDKNDKLTLIKPFREALGGTKAAVTWQRLFLSRLEATALGVLLLAEYGWNLSVIDQAEVPRATPDPGEDGHPTYRIPLEKFRRGAGHHYETRNVTDDGAASKGRLITQALQATRFARAIVEDLAPDTNRLMVWRTGHQSERTPSHGDRLPPVGPFRFGVHAASAREWAVSQGLGGSPFQRGRRTVNALDRREPGQNSQETHDRNYVLPDKQVQERSVEIIAVGAEDAADRARKAVLIAQVRVQADPLDRQTATADCGDWDNAAYPLPGGGCGVPSFLGCLGCENAKVHPGHHSRLAHLHQALGNLWSVLPPELWESDWGEGHDRLEDLKTKLGQGLWSQALDRISHADRGIVDALITGDLDA